MEERLRILESIEAGEISVEEGARRLQALAHPSELQPALVESPTAISRPGWAQWLWQFILWLGIALMAGGGSLLVSYYVHKVVIGRLIWGWITFALGIVVVLLGWWLQRAQWLLIRIRRPTSSNISLAFPLPLDLIVRLIQFLQPFVPQIEEMGVDEILLALRDEMHKGQPFLVEVGEGEGGEQVLIYFG